MEGNPDLQKDGDRIVLSASGLRKSFGLIEAVSDLSLVLRAGETIALIGPNGAGKTTTLRILSTLLSQDEGNIIIMGQDTKDPFKVRHFIGYMPDVLGIYPEMLVWEYLEFFARCYQIEEHLIEFRIQEVASFAGLENLLDVQTSDLSRGMIQRVSLARAILHDPPILLLDEPAAGLDPNSRSEFRHRLHVLRNKGKATIISSHLLSDLEETCTHIALMNKGRIILIEEMATFLKKSKVMRTFRVNVLKDNERVLAFLSEQKNISGLRWDGESLLFESTLENEGAVKILRSLVEEGFEVEGFSEVPLSLEDAYLFHLAGI